MGFINNSEEMTTAKFLQMIRDLVQLGDLGKNYDVAQIVGLEFTSKPWGRGTQFDATNTIPWMFRLEYRLNDNEAPRIHKQYIDVYIKTNVLCITLEDLWSNFGRDYVLSEGPLPSFINPQAEAEFWKEVREGSGIYAMYYKISEHPKIVVGFNFGRRKCVGDAIVSITRDSSD